MIIRQSRLLQGTFSCFRGLNGPSPASWNGTGRRRRGAIAHDLCGPAVLPASWVLCALCNGIIRAKVPSTYRKNASYYATCHATRHPIARGIQQKRFLAWRRSGGRGGVGRSGESKKEEKERVSTGTLFELLEGKLAEQQHQAGSKRASHLPFQYLAPLAVCRSPSCGFLPSPPPGDDGRPPSSAARHGHERTPPRSDRPPKAPPSRRRRRWEEGGCALESVEM
jgi:hypothetical protein